MQHSVSLKIRGHDLKLLPQKAILWKSTQTLVVSDLHLGKAGHFRKSGIPAPEGVNHKNIVRLDSLIKHHKPNRLLILGDLFHSDANREWLDFERFTEKWKSVKMVLIRGNHDSLHRSFYEAAGIISLDSLEESGLLFLHDANDAPPGNDVTVLSGHIHPGIVMRGKGRQSLRLPCFLISDKQMILPAFGEFTGLHTIKPEPDEKIYAVAENKVIPL